MATRAARRASAQYLSCPICLDEFEAPVVTPCGHRFCEKCIKSALQLKRECPSCRSAICSHRELRADPQLAAVVHSTPKVLEADEGCGAPAESWACTICTMSNPMGAGRCLACSCRRPAKLTWRPSVTLVESSLGGESAETGARGTAVSDDHDSECDFDEESACDEEGEGEDDEESSEEEETVEVRVVDGRAVRLHWRAPQERQPEPSLRRANRTPFWVRRKRAGHNQQNAAGGEAQKAWSMMEDEVLMQAFEAAESSTEHGLKRAGGRPGHQLTSVFWEGLLVHLPGRTLTAARKRFRRLAHERAHPKAPATEVDLTSSWPQKDADWVDAKLWPGAASSGWIVYESSGSKRQKVWANESRGERHTQRRHVLAQHEADMKVALSDVAPTNADAVAADTASHDELREEWEGVPLLLSSKFLPSNTGYQCVSFVRTPGLLRPFHVHDYATSTRVGDFVTALEGAVAYARFIGKEGVMAERARVREEDERRERRMTIEDAEARAAELRLCLVRDPRTKLGFCGVRHAPRCKFLPYMAVGQQQGNKVTIGHYSTVAEAALAYARWLGPEQSCGLAQRKQELCAAGWAFGERQDEAVSGENNYKARKKRVRECGE